MFCFYLGSRRSNSGNSSRGGSGMSIQSDHRSSPSASRREARTSHSGGQTRLNRLTLLDNSGDFTPEPQNGKVYLLFIVVIYLSGTSYP